MIFFFTKLSASKISELSVPLTLVLLRSLPVKSESELSINRTDFSCIIKLPNKNYINFNGESVFRSKKEAPLGWKEALMSIGEFADYVYE